MLTRLRQQTYETIRELIITARLKPRERLSDLFLAEELGVSRTPVREALNQLVAEGLVVMDKKGTFVADLDMGHMVDAYQMRAVLEGFAARLATSRMEPGDILEMKKFLQVQSDSAKGGSVLDLTRAGTDFHLVLLNKCGNSMIIQTVRRLMDQCERFRAVTHYSAVMRDFLIAEHEEIVKVVEQGDPAGVEEVVRSHLLRTSERISQLGRQLSDWRT
ncbi:MAG: GntR family transcriptional regulator [Bacillota bacterium]